MRCQSVAVVGGGVGGWRIQFRWSMEEMDER